MLPPPLKDPIIAHARTITRNLFQEYVNEICWRVGYFSFLWPQIMSLPPEIEIE